jgi:hypothetical protein
MAINFTDSPANGATQVIDGRTYTYNSAKNKWDTTATEVVGPTATVYATVDNLPGSATTGDQAFVSGTNRLYIWNGSGWYNIALINTNPSISGASSSYTLATDGTATVVSIVASDPEGLPITYSIISDTSGSVATVVQGTGLNTNSWTITPSTSNADAGTFSLTFRASDGINIASAISSFTLQFSVENQNYTTALITSVGANLADNNNFVDSSTNSHTITAAGNATQNTFSPYRHGGYSTYFDGSGDYLQLSASNAWGFGNGAWTVEFWIKTTATDADAIAAFNSGSPYNGWSVRITSGLVKMFVGDGSTYEGFTTISGTTTVNDNDWHHVAVTSPSGSNTISCYVDGVLAGSHAFSIAIDSTGQILRVGADTNSSPLRPLNGYLTDVRIVKGAQVYTSAFTPPTERLTAITNTSLLTCHLPYIADGSTNSHAITVVGNTKTEPFAPYDTQEYAAADHGGSMYFDGSGDNLTTPTHASFSLGSGDLTIEGWFYNTSTAEYQFIFDGRQGAGASDTTYLYTNNGTTLKAGFGNTNDSTAATIVQNQWYHFAIVRSGSGTNNVTLYLNGKNVLNITDNTDLSSSTRMTVGSRYTIVNDFGGHVSDFRVVKGTAVYTSAFTPPTAPLTAITNTSLLLKGTDAGIIDKSQSVKSITLNGDVKSSTTQTKYLSSSMYFDGTGDWLTIPTSTELNMGTGDLTVEAWLYQTSAPADYQMIVSSVGSNGNYYITIRGGGTGGQVEINVGGVAFQVSLNNSVTDNTWYHFAATRSSGTWNIFINGTSIGTASSAGAWDLGNGGMYVGRFGGGTAYAWPGYMSDVRITKGLARYTANFTPPTAALQG